MPCGGDAMKDLIIRAFDNVIKREIAEADEGARGDQAARHLLGWR